MDTLTIVGGGVAGLVAAITAAEAGARVVLHEARAELGGRGRSLPDPYRASLGPHALYEGPFRDWLAERSILPPGPSPALSAIRWVERGKAKHVPVALVRGMALARRTEPPIELSFREWASRHASARAVDAVCGALAINTFHHDPGELGAVFGHDRLRRLLKSKVFYVEGGWQRLVDTMAARARQLGVEIYLSSKVQDLPAAPVVVALELPAAARLIGDDRISWPGPRTVLLDLGLRSDARDRGAVAELDEKVYASRYSRVDPTLAPTGHELIQAQAGVRPGETAEGAAARIEATLDHGFRGWRAREVWRRRTMVDGGAGAADPPGSTWRDRPAVDRGAGVFLAGDRVAAPGLLAEVSFHSGRDAALAAIGAAPAVGRR